MDEDDIVYPERTVTCRTAGCENEGIGITLPCADLVICGVCQEVITDVKLVV